MPKDKKLTRLLVAAGKKAKKKLLGKLEGKKTPYEKDGKRAHYRGLDRTSNKVMYEKPSQKMPSLGPNGFR